LQSGLGIVLSFQRRLEPSPDLACYLDRSHVEPGQILRRHVVKHVLGVSGAEPGHLEREQICQGFELRIFDLGGFPGAILFWTDLLPAWVG
jgi:hypothetical protein